MSKASDVSNSVLRLTHGDIESPVALDSKCL
jgi:hypothetical protein